MPQTRLTSTKRFTNLNFYLILIERVISHMNLHYIFLGSERLLGTHMNALNPFNSKRMTLTARRGLWTFLAILALCVPYASTCESLELFLLIQLLKRIRDLGQLDPSQSLFQKRLFINRRFAVTCAMNRSWSEFFFRFHNEWRIYRSSTSNLKHTYSCLSNSRGLII